MERQFVVTLAGSKYPASVWSSQDLTTNKLTEVYPLKKIYLVDGPNRVIYFPIKGKFLIADDDSVYLTVCGKKGILKQYYNH